MNWQAVIGLEVHVELKTKSKMYCSCKNQFGGQPNTRCCPVCTGMPGALPKLNKKAVEYAIRTGIAVEACIASETRQYRKNYFYPDLPKGYQISQFTLPLCTNGTFKYYYNNKACSARIRQIHIEEDAGKLIHSPNGETIIDYNRCGVPLIEIVTQPDFYSAEQARAFLESLKVLLLYLDVSDCRMQEGSLRCDVNVSVRTAGDTELMPRVEMKNINTFSGAERAIKYEIQRQCDILNSGGEVLQETRRWDDVTNTSAVLRTKENAADYRYFPEPDIPCICISSDDVQRIGKNIPELEFEKRRRYLEEYKLAFDTATQLSANHDLALFFDDCISGGAPVKETANLLIGQVLNCINDSGKSIVDSGLTAENFSDIIGCMCSDRISATSLKKAVAYLFDNGGTAEEAVAKLNLEQISDTHVIEELVDDILNENPEAISDFRAGKKNALGFLTGQCMRKSEGKANPRLLAVILNEKLERWSV